MPVKKAKPRPRRAPKPTTAKQAAAKRVAARGSTPRQLQAGEPPSTILQPSDIRMVVRDLAGDIAPDDVGHLVSEEANLRAQGEKWASSRFPRLTAQLNVALDLLRDFHEGDCPQIPYSTISLVGGAVTYYANSLDLIPDFLGRIGRADDAAVMETAFRLAAGGVRRYCTWRGIDPDRVIGPPRRLRPTPSRRDKKLPARG